MEIRGDGYSVTYDAMTDTIHFSGALRLGGPEEYKPLESLLGAAIGSEPARLTIDVCELEFLNSSGINVLYKFAVNARKLGNLHLIAVGSNRVPWQGKSLPNLTKLNPRLELCLLE